MRISTPFLAGACILLTIGSLLALISRCCYSHAAIFAALLFTLGGLSVGVGVVWFISVVSEEFGTSFGRKTSWVGMYAYWYGWSLGAAGGAGIGALLAALLTAHAHVSRHTPHFSHVCEDALQRPLLRCRSEGCLGGRSCTSDTLRTYLTSDSRRVCGGRTCTHGQIVDRSPSLVDLTRSSIESSRQDHLQDTSVSNATSDDDILNIVQQHQPLQHYQGSQCSHSQAQSEQQTVQKPQGDQSKVQYHYQHQNTHHKQAKKVVSEKSQSNTTSDESKLMSQAIVETPKTITSSSIVSTAPTHTSSSPSSGSSSTTGNQSLSQQLQHNQHYQTLQPHHHQHSQHAHHHTPQHPHHSEQNTQNDQPQKHSQRSHLARQSSVPPRASLIPATCPPPPTLPTNASTSSQGSSVRQSSSCSSSEPSRLPQLNTFTSDYSKTLPLKEVRRMAVFNRGNTSRSTTLSRPSAKLSSEV